MTKQSMPIYLDNHATTPLDPRVKSKMIDYMDTFYGNASSSDHLFGDDANQAVKQARIQVARLVGANPTQVYFTSGTTESINLALQGYVHKHYQGNPLRLATLPTEHKAVLDTCRALAAKGLIEIVWLKLNQFAQLDLEALQQELEAGLDLLVIMAANNEVGTIYPVQTIAKMAGAFATPFFCDASQAAGKVELAFNDWEISFLALTAHKMYGPKGCGALIMQSDIVIEPLIYGGGHQKSVRPGTLNVPGIVGLGEACHLRQQEMHDDEARMAQYRDHLQNRLQSAIPELVVNGDLQHRLAGNLHISIPGIENQMMIAQLRPSLAISTGSACTSGVVEPSHVLQAMGLSNETMDGALRIGIGKFTTGEEIRTAAELIITAYKKLKR